MNEILQKRIEKAAFDHGVNCLKVMCADPEHNWPTNTEDTFKTACKWMLDNQWISVEEALPPKEDNDSSITVLVHCQKGWCGIDYYRYKYDEWLNNGNSVTHWMPIPELKGGEK